jgi:hypothetical protein
VSFFFAMRYTRYKFPFLNNIIDPDVDLDSLHIVWSEEYKSRFVVDSKNRANLPAEYAYKILSADFLSFIHNELPWQISHLEIYPLLPNTNCVIVQEIEEEKRNNIGLYITTGGVSWNIHDITGFRRRQVSRPDYTTEAWPTFCAFSKPVTDADPSDKWLDSSEIPILETYKNYGFIGNGSVPHSLRSDNSEKSVFFIISFEIPFDNNIPLLHKQLDNAFKKWTI